MNYRILCVSNQVHVGEDEPTDKSKVWLRNNLEHLQYNIFDNTARIIDTSLDISSLIPQQARFGFTTYRWDLDGSGKPLEWLIYDENEGWKRGRIIDGGGWQHDDMSYDGTKLVFINSVADFTYEESTSTLRLTLADNYTTDYLDAKGGYLQWKGK